ncbi:MAG: hypothetical protein IT211_04495 [Armatimonadetes bacterium]|nr:hypothetical protein [Armatimonadota bacterium]
MQPIPQPTATTTQPRQGKPLMVDTLKPSELPVEIKVRGRAQLGLQWEDANGENLLVESVFPPYDEKLPDRDGMLGMTSELLAKQYIRRDTGWALLWDIADAVRHCEFDITLKFLSHPTITDLDSNGVTETTLLYKLACRSDVSPASMKLLMHENNQKFALRGVMFIDYSGISDAPESNRPLPTDADICCLDDLDHTAIEANGEYWKMDGKFQNTRDFQNAPDVFLKHARKLWLQHLVEKFD